MTATCRAMATREKPRPAAFANDIFGGLWDSDSFRVFRSEIMAVDVIPMIAQRYQVPEEKVRELHRRMQETGGRQCQFECAELGGPVQWMPGMIMVSRWNDHALRARAGGGVRGNGGGGELVAGEVRAPGVGGGAERGEVRVFPGTSAVVNSARGAD
jgi:hypothetical protein